jgi:hypothetical protein
MTVARGHRALVVLAVLGVARTAAPQVVSRDATAVETAEPAPAASPTPDPTPPPLAEKRTPRSLGPAFDADLLQRLPLGHGLWSVFETVEPTAILDRMDTGGLYLGEPGLMGIRGSSWTQASWTLGDLDITDPDRTGTPMFIADPETLDAIEVGAGLAPADERGAGPGVGLVVRRPGGTWHRMVQASAAPSSLQQDFQGGGAPVIAHLNSFASGRFRVDGPLVKDRLGLLISGTLARGSRVERANPRSLEGREADLLAHLVFTPRPRDEFRLLAAVQSLTHPYAGRARFGDGDVREADRFLVAQSTWQRRGTRPWSLTTGVVRGTFDPHLPDFAPGGVESLADGPVQLQYPGAASRRRWALSGWLDPVTSEHHAVRVGTSWSLTQSTTRPAGLAALTPETVAGVPARVWNYGWAGPVSKWRGSELSAYATDHVHYGVLAVDAGLRYETSRATRAGSDGQITWTGLTPRLLIRVHPLPHERPNLALLAGYAWYYNRLPLHLLAYGDPTAAQGRVFQWLDRNGDGRFQQGERGPMISRVGPGGSYSSIDPGLKPPLSKEFFLGFEAGIGGVQFRGLAYHRRERDLVASVNVGAPASAYDVHYVRDPGNDIVGSGDDWWLPIFDRRPETFGDDRYLLTNDTTKATDQGLELSVNGRIGKRLRLLAGATASKTHGPAAYRGFLATQNDQDVIGDRLELPNAATLSRGRLFFERGYTIKIAGAYEAPRDVHLAVVARYQDGQHFARLVIPTDLNLNQGPEPVRGIRNGQSRFTYVLTIDARLEKGFAVGGTRLAGVLEAFNVGGTGIEVEENVIWGPAYRATSAVQPPRAVRLGLRLDF